MEDRSVKKTQPTDLEMIMDYNWIEPQARVSWSANKEPTPGSPQGLHVRTQENSWTISSLPSPTSDLVLCKQYMQMKSSYCTRREQWHQKTTRKQCANRSTAAPGSVPWLNRCKVAIRGPRASEAQGLASLSWPLRAELHLSSLHQTQLCNRSDFWQCSAFFCSVQLLYLL